MMIGAASSEVTKIPAAQDLYFNLTGEQVFNNADILRCEVMPAEANGSNESSYTGVPMLQFDLSGLNMTDNDIGILVLKAASVEKQDNESAMVAVLPVGSQWNEESDFVELVMNFLPIWNAVKNNDMTQMGISTDDDKIFAFDVSAKLMDAKAKGDRISFLMLAISNSSYKVDFMSREAGEGPYLIVMPYPSNSMANLTMPLARPLPINESAMNMNQTLAAPVNGSLLMNNTQVTPEVIEVTSDNESSSTGTVMQVV